MTRSDWAGVFPAITTPFLPDGGVNSSFIAQHVDWQKKHGCVGFVPLGSLGEGGNLTYVERDTVLRATVEGAAGAPVVPGIAAMSTAQAVDYAKQAARAGCQGLMVLPPYVYPGDRREITEHFRAVAAATDLSVMLYNNPVAYGIDYTPDWIEEIAGLVPNLHSVKESSTDVRRLAEIRRRMGDRLALFVGVDDIAMEGFLMGAEGWIAGLVNAFPAESVRLFELCRAGRVEEARKIYEWFLPLLRLDVVPKFVQLIKLTQQEVGWGSEAVRAPRLTLTGAEREAALAVIQHGIAHRP